MRELWSTALGGVGNVALVAAGLDGMLRPILMRLLPTQLMVIIYSSSRNMCASYLRLHLLAALYLEADLLFALPFMLKGCAGGGSMGALGA